MTAVEVMDGEIVRRWLGLAADALDRTRAQIDALNVFPVPDSDTGTNLHATIACAALALAAVPPQASQAEVWQVAASAALSGACGNSGIIVSQLLRGLADTCGPAAPCDGRVVAAALRHTAGQARAAVRRPVDGTVLTVADAAARAAEGATSLAEVSRAAALGARAALIRTQHQLEALAASGVVDAGGAGLCVVLDALSAAICGTHPASYEVPGRSGGAGVSAAAALAAAGRRPASPHHYEVTFALEAGAPAVAGLAQTLDALGDSLVIAGSEPRWHVHIHVTDAGAVIEAGLAAGLPSKVKITFLNGPRANVPAVRPTPSGRSAVAESGGALAGLLGEADVVVVERSSRGGGARPGARPAGHWPPGWPVLEIGSAVQLVAALAVRDPAGEPHGNVAAMRRAVAGMRHGSVDRAQAGAGLVGRVAGQVVARGEDQARVALAVAGPLVTPDTELITLLAGQDADDDLRGVVTAHVAVMAPAAEVVCYDGGMTTAVLLIGAE